jgi:hypothetical protein
MSKPKQEKAMAHTVVKAFKSQNRKFAPGDAITASDIDAGSAYSLQDWIARGFVSSDAPAPVAPSHSGRGRSQPAAPSSEENSAE